VTSARTLDQRLLVAACVLLYLLVVIVGGRFVPYGQLWHDWLGVPAMSPLFGDTHIVLAAGECTRQGYDPLLVNPCDAHARALPYPRVWSTLGVLGLGTRFTTPVGIFIGAVFFVAALAFIGRLRRVEHGLLYAALLCSPPFMLGVERGNVDLLIFALLAGAAALMARPLEGRAYLLPYLVIVFAGILKLHPIVALVAVVREPARRAALALALCGGLFALYLVVTWDDLQAIQRGVVGWVNSSHGSLVLPELLAGRARGTLVARVPGWMVLVPVVYAAVVAWVTFRLRPSAPRPTTPGFFLDAFRAGAALWGATFVIGHNFDYRLIMLLLTVPQMLAWAQAGGALSRSAHVAAWTLAAACWLSWTDVYPLVDEVLLWLLYGWYVHAVIRTLPWTAAPQTGD
jgi:hypothetical protein